jgi:hypothetical protein
VYFLSDAGLIACKDVGLFDAFSCPWPPSSTFYKLREIERVVFDDYLPKWNYRAVPECTLKRELIVGHILNQSFAPMPQGATDTFCHAREPCRQLRTRRWFSCKPRFAGCRGGR